MRLEEEGYKISDLSLSVQMSGIKHTCAADSSSERGIVIVNQ
jgi:hypothetical protein